jgi:hypothetical protein
VPLKEEEGIVTPNIQLIPERNPLTSAMIGNLVRHFVDARNDDATCTNIRNITCIVDSMCCGEGGGSLALSATVDVLVTSSNGSLGPSQTNVLIVGTSLTTMAAVVAHRSTGMMLGETSFQA